ncbi:glycosyltransferase [Pelomonas sp. CA6]|uniref:glycosyltransferase n=1 Tax=Pelomonas sp. CA6 TaxID=2907999 RepID=UPI001F4C0923|nr:glycosyltransferase [Pelomonas sp. CA6]MCH7344992.1 glycosyltransferase [Pelomonas sp. CA6]
MKVCLVQYNPFHPKVGILDAYNEVVESYHWGFLALGHQVERRINHFDPDALNIVFGFQIPMQLGLMPQFPDNTIFFNMERYAGVNLRGTAAEQLASRFQIWDYSRSNVDTWNALGPRFPAYHALTAYAPNLEKVPKGVEQDIDVLYYGNLTPDRVESLHKIAGLRRDLTGLSVMTLCNVWGRQRDEFIARAKVIVNFSRGNIFEIVRVSYLMANAKAVVCDYSEELEIEPDLRGPDGLTFVKTPEIQAACEALVADDARREAYARQGYELIRRRDIRDVIRGFFG